MHKGIITSNQEIRSLVEKTFNSSVLEKLKDVLYKIISGLTKTINDYELNKNSNLIISISDTVGFLNQISLSNPAIMHLVVDLFEINIPFKTCHSCFQFYEENNEIFVKQFTPERISQNSSTLREHDCKCSVLQNILRIWNKNFDKEINIGEIFINFLQSYKFKFLLGYSYISLFDIIVQNESDKLKGISVQIMTIDDIAFKIVSCEGFIEELFNKFYFYLKDNQPNYHNITTVNSIVKTTLEFKYDIFYLIKEKSSIKIGMKVNVSLYFYDLKRSSRN